MIIALYFEKSFFTNVKHNFKTSSPKSSPYDSLCHTYPFSN